MRKLILFLFLLIGSTSVFSQVIPFEGSLNEAKELSAKSGKPIVYMASSTS